MSGISGGNLGGKRDLSKREDEMYQRQIDRIRAEEGSGKPKARPKVKGRTPTVDYFRARSSGPIGRRANEDDDA